MHACMYVVGRAQRGRGRGSILISAHQSAVQILVITVEGKSTVLYQNPLQNHTIYNNPLSIITVCGMRFQAPIPMFNIPCAAN